MATLAEGRKAVACSHPLDPKSILLITLGVGGIVCDIADEGVSQVVLTRLNLAQGELSQRLNR